MAFWSRGRDTGDVTSAGYSELDPGELEAIDAEECWTLLESQSVGRFAVVVGPYPLVFPVNYAVDRHRIVFRTGAGTKLWSIHRSNVTFQVDQIDPVHRSGWSVMAWGAADEVTEGDHPGIEASATAGGAVPWAPGPRGHIVRMVVDGISGRRIRPAEQPLAGDPRAYL
jgi:nitroimidazol reductase NimA-like FMN-containing flavoprotein (pyridoxamine 5'-phosphate oxidase superfamily)